MGKVYSFLTYIKIIKEFFFLEHIKRVFTIMFKINFIYDENFIFFVIKFINTKVSRLRAKNV